ncbi:hypothetical protein O7627_23265 [Solwaraspora sp. WMMD1047]|uniref:hypothetical protein n=1 Tax=Solwaraspora sp. WMMD1047 TaxID=3016102 RepID=UPI00241788C5|nr:hypothetical protein [Solwaraspora sp. WMMD1047]MDG4832206.1 hypothetical protein [Solwaraspora sp. WMMD1047]
MAVPGRRPARWVAAVAALPLALGGCGLVGGAEPDPAGSTIVDDGADEARQLVQRYLDAMTAKDTAAGRGQLCAAMHEAFDQGATGPNGDFADHFTVTGASIVDIRADNGGQQVSTAITVESGGRKIPARILFVVARTEAGWCIADERVGGNTPAPAGSATATPG